MQKHFVKPFHFDAARPCYCGSDKPFGECCASTAPEREPPRGVTVVQNFLAPAECRKLTRFADKQQARWLKVIDMEKSTEKKQVERRDPGRVTQVVDSSKRQGVLDDLFRRAMAEVVTRRYGAPDFFEPPYILRYKVGGKYSEHADSEAFDVESRRFHRVADRDVSLLLYLNDDYEGGELTFTRLNYTYRPQAGDLVLFPSNNVFLHRAEQVTRGTKYAVVSWCCLKATPKLFPGASRWEPIRV